ncbi:MAG: carboxymuconolactone decarboxylase family protein [SAR202 cluster bacterium]|nr:carboxymuconolactone decarboxylase family protein [SAR202 cluster bacterium]
MPVDKEEELKRVTDLRGFRYGLHDFLAEVDPDFLKAVNDTVESQYINTQILDRKTKELAIIVACISQVDMASHLQIHMHAAVQAGATGAEILSIINLVGDWIGHVARIRALEAWRIYFRPDLPTIDRVIELRETAK